MTKNTVLDLSKTELRSRSCFKPTVRTVSAAPQVLRTGIGGAERVPRPAEEARGGRPACLGRLRLGRVQEVAVSSFVRAQRQQVNRLASASMN